MSFFLNIVGFRIIRDDIEIMLTIEIHFFVTLYSFVSQLDKHVYIILILVVRLRKPHKKAIHSFLFSFGFLGHTRWCSGATSGMVLKSLLLTMLRMQCWDQTCASSMLSMHTAHELSKSLS